MQGSRPGTVFRIESPTARPFVVRLDSVTYEGGGRTSYECTELHPSGRKKHVFTDKSFRGGEGGGRLLAVPLPLEIEDDKVEEFIAFLESISAI